MFLDILVANQIYQTERYKGRIYSWTTSQKPDILLEAEFEAGEKVYWVFDAKYRIAADDNGIDYAINQMHRYRDALIHIHKANDGW